jgi:hypothetical protein
LALYLGDIAWLPVLLESYFRNNADLGTGLLIAHLAITSPYFFARSPVAQADSFSTAGIPASALP